MEQSKLDAVFSERLDQRQFGAVKRPVRGEITAVFVTVRVAQHDFLPVATAGKPRAVARQRERRAHDFGTALQIINGLEQWNDVQRELVAAQQANFLEQDADFQEVAHRLAFGDHIVRQRCCTEAPVNVRAGPQDGKLRCRARRILQVR